MDVKSSGVGIPLIRELDELKGSSMSDSSLVPFLSPCASNS